MFLTRYPAGFRRAPDTRARHRGIRALGLLLVLIALVLPGAGARAQATDGAVRVVRIEGTIDLGLAPYLSRALREAEGAGARAVILEINTPGGRLDAVLQMRDALLASPVRTIAFVNREAFSAGALIALASEEIYMAPGAVIGAATPVTGSGEQADEKTLSAVRKTFKATAETRGRDPLIAEAMVDRSVAIEGLNPAGRLLTLTTQEAAARGFSDGTVPDRAALLRATGLAGATVEETAISPAEGLVRLLTEPALGGLLFAVGVLLILGSLFSGEVGPLTGLGAGVLALFFWGHTLAGLAGWEGIALVVLGIVLLAAEVFILPGFGIAGVSGILALLGGLFLSVTSRDLPATTDIERAGASVLVALLTLIAGGGLLLWLIPVTGRWRGMVLQEASASRAALGPDTHTTPLRAARRPGPWRLAQWLTGEAARGEQRLAPDTRQSLERARGKALSDLRPGGFALIDGARVDVVTRGDVIPAGATIEVVRDEGYRRVVRQVGADEREIDVL